MSELKPHPDPTAPPRLIVDPEAVPLDVAFADLAARGAAVAAERLRPDALRTRLAAPPAWRPEMTGDEKLALLPRPPRPASVLIPLVVRNDDVSVLLTRRTSHLHDHAGQISFPGGRADAGDRDAIATALRESQEEIGLAPEAVDVIGTLPLYITITAYRVTPVVALIEREFSLTLDDFEVEEAFEVPLSFLMDPANHERRRIEMGSVSRAFYAMPYADPRAAKRYFIWGATAAMLRNFYHLLAA
jgi:8-oxo-dGTP pyrophosphatase MutT (NUDIX family)